MAIADFCSQAELLTYMRTDATGVDPVTSALAITAASDAIRQTTDRPFELQTAAADRYYTATYPYSANLGALAYWYPWPGVFPFTALTSTLPAPTLKVDDYFLSPNGAQTLGQITVTDKTTQTTYTPTYAYPYNADAKGDAFTHLVFAPGTTMSTTEGQLKVNAKWGWIVVPATVKNACLLQASRYVKRRESPTGILGIDAIGGVLRVNMKLDPDIDQMLSSFRRLWAAA
jgi:hypothetical protein